MEINMRTKEQCRKKNQCAIDDNMVIHISTTQSYQRNEPKRTETKQNETLTINEGINQDVARKRHR